MGKTQRRSIQGPVFTQIFVVVLHIEHASEVVPCISETSCISARRTLSAWDIQASKFSTQCPQIERNSVYRIQRSSCPPFIPEDEMRSILSNVVFLKQLQLQLTTDK
jgi:hypothetical protein